ncbi:response regulator transcription factor [Streptomyces sp. NRAIS4]
MTSVIAEPLSPLALARVSASVQRNQGNPAARTVQLLLDEIDRLKSPQALADWDPGVECPLPRRQLEVLLRMANGDNTSEIAKALGIDAKTVRKHRARAMARLGVRSSTAAVVVCLTQGWFPAGAVALPEPRRHPSPVMVANTYRERAAVLRETPGEWGTVATYDSGPTARQSALRLRSGAFKAFSPAGAWEAEAFTEDGAHGVRARFIGNPTTEREAS